MALGYPGLGRRRRSTLGATPGAGGLAAAIDGLAQPASAMRVPGRLRPQQIATRTANQNFRRQQRLWGEQIIPELGRLRSQANQDRFSDTERSHYLAPRLDALDAQMRGAEGDLSRNLAARGLGDSSAMTSGLGALYSGGAQARAGMIGDLFQEEENRQLDAQRRLQDFSAGLYGNANQSAGSLALALEQLRLQEEAQNAANDSGGLFGDLFGGLGGILGTAAGLGWNPLRRKK